MPSSSFMEDGSLNIFTVSESKLDESFPSPQPIEWLTFCLTEEIRIYMVAGYCFTVYPKKYAHGFVVLCFVVVMQSFIMNSHELFIHIHQGCFAGTGAIVRLPQCQWSDPGGYGKISQCITTTKHSKAKTVCIFLGIYCICALLYPQAPVWYWAWNISCFWNSDYWNTAI